MTETERADTAEFKLAMLQDAITDYLDAKAKRGADTTLATFGAEQRAYKTLKDLLPGVKK